jgi:hypothetical protein
MSALGDPFDVLVTDTEADEFAALSRKPVAPPPLAAAAGAATARFHGFDLDDQPLVVGVPGLTHEVIRARSIADLRRADLGSAVVLLFESGDVRRPIIVGVLRDPASAPAGAAPGRLVEVQSDEDRVVLSAEREIVLRCGDASITLTRAGKVLIKGAYIMSRSTGCNRIKGAAVDIN